MTGDKTRPPLFANVPYAFKFAAVSAVALAVFFGFMNVRFTSILSSNEFCATVLTATKVTDPSNPNAGVVACANMMVKQITAVANNSYIYSVSQSLCLVALVIIVLAGGRFELTANKDGGSVKVQRDAAEQAAEQVADAAVDKVAEIKSS